MIIGGAEDKLRKRTILKEFVAASGGARGPDRGDPDRLVAWAPRSSRSTTRCSGALGAAEVVAVRPESRDGRRTTRTWWRCWRAPPASS